MNAEAIAALRDPRLPPPRRALIAAFLAAGLAPEPDPAAAAADDPAARLFEYGIVHADAIPFAGGRRSGTITYADDERVEQYVGARSWVRYPAARFAPRPLPGDQLRVTAQGDRFAIEAIGPNRLRAAATPREARSGMTIAYETPPERADVVAALEAVAARYGARFAPGADEIGACAIDGDGARLAARFAGGGARLRLETSVRDDRAEAALTAERALVLAAAVCAGPSAGAVDDGGAVFAPAELTTLAERNATRGDAFAFAAALAQRAAPAPVVPIHGAGAGGDELVVFSPRPRGPDDIGAVVGAALAGLGAAAARTGDPVPPSSGTAFTAAGGVLRRLFRLDAGAAALDVLWLDAAADDDGVRALLAARADVAALLRAPIGSVTVFAYGAVDDAAPPDASLCDCARADALATVLAAALARRDDAIALDASGRLWCADDLISRALRRDGRGE